MEVKSKVFKYIEEERDISKYKISILKQRASSPSQRRLLDIEKEFLSIPLESMNFEDVADVATAISIYRTSRVLFYQTYHLKPPGFYQINKTKFYHLILQKAEFIKAKGKELVGIRSQELNLVQNSEFYYDLAKRQSAKNSTSIDFEKRNLDAMDLKQLLDLEPLTIAKKRARAQAITYSLGLYLLDSISCFNVSSKDSLEHLQDKNRSLDLVISNAKKCVYLNFNRSLAELPIALKGTMGENPYVAKLHKLHNILDFNSLKKTGLKPIINSSSFSSSTPSLGNLFQGVKKPIALTPSKDRAKDIQNKVYGILFPIPRKGNEKLSLLYKKIIVDDVDISHLFSNNLSNIKVSNGNSKVYYKAFLMHPLWKLINLSRTDNPARDLLSKLLKISLKDFENINFEDTDVVAKINQKQSHFINVSPKSIILTAKTRSEEEGLADIYSIIDSRLSEIKSDYSYLIDKTNQILYQ